MPGFAEIASGHWSLKGLVASMVLVLVGGIMTIYYQVAGTSVGTSGSGLIPLKCVNENCGYLIEVDGKKYAEIIQKANNDWMQANGVEIPKPGDPGAGMGPMGPMGMGMAMPQWGQPGTEYGLPCPKCAENSMYRHIKCAKCGEIFLEDFEQSPFDKCPKCGYSASEERRKQRTEEKKSESDKKASRSKSRNK